MSIKYPESKVNKNDESNVSNPVLSK